MDHADPGSGARCRRAGTVSQQGELERASRFRFPHLAGAYVITHGVLRLLLARYLDRDPAGISFEHGVQGKPAVSKNPQLDFNLTHSEGMAAVAVTVGCALGLDLEHLRPIPDIEEIAGTLFLSGGGRRTPLARARPA